MNELSDYQYQKGFTLEGSVLVAWKKASEDKREFVGMHVAGFDESIAELMEINSSDSEVKYNILVPVHQLENLTLDEKKEMIIQNLSNRIWNWKEEYDFNKILNIQLFM